MSYLEDAQELSRVQYTDARVLDAFATLALAEETRAANYLAMAALYPAGTDTHARYRRMAEEIIG